MTFMDKVKKASRSLVDTGAKTMLKVRGATNLVTSIIMCIIVLLRSGGEIPNHSEILSMVKSNFLILPSTNYLAFRPTYNS